MSRPSSSAVATIASSRQQRSSSAEKITPTVAAHARLKILRRALGLTQQEFAARYQIRLGTLRDWEQGAKKPD